MVTQEHTFKISSTSLNTWARRVHETAVDHGWYEGRYSVPGIDMSSFSIPEKLLLIHSEVTEAVEAWREVPSNKPLRAMYFDTEGKPEGIGVELVDVIIRTLDLMAALKIDNIEEIMEAKASYNDTRPHRHGGLKA